MVENKDEFIDSNQEKSVSSILSLKQSLSILKQEFQDWEKPTDADNKLWQLTEKVALMSELETAKMEQLMQEHPELHTLMESIVKKVNNNDTAQEKNDLFDQEKKLLVDLWYSVLASMHKQEAEKNVKWYAQWSTDFFKFIPWYSYLVEKALA
jgi:hypothetical protein